jgi:hypothetical protein
MTLTSRQRPYTVQDNEVVVTASKPGHLFRLVDSLLYNQDADEKERLVIPESLVQDILQDAYNDKHHFGRDRMIKELDSVYFRSKRALIDKYITTCHTCGANRQANQLLVGSY